VLTPQHAIFVRYHSTGAVLLDARIFIDGGTGTHFQSGIAPTSYHITQILRPPYLSGAPQSGISTAPDSVGYSTSGTFQINVSIPSVAEQITKISLLRAASFTHGIDMNQRYVELGIVNSGFTAETDPSGPAIQFVDVRQPEDANVCPPGWYVLYAVSASGVPSVGRFIHIP
jgi:hypothetical protein